MDTYKRRQAYAERYNKVRCFPALKQISVADNAVMLPPSSMKQHATGKYDKIPSRLHEPDSLGKILTDGSPLSSFRAQLMKQHEQTRSQVYSKFDTRVSKK